MLNANVVLLFIFRFHSSIILGMGYQLGPITSYLRYEHNKNLAKYIRSKLIVGA